MGMLAGDDVGWTVGPCFEYDENKNKWIVYNTWYSEWNTIGAKRKFAEYETEKEAKAYCAGYAEAKQQCNYWGRVR